MNDNLKAAYLASLYDAIPKDKIFILEQALDDFDENKILYLQMIKLKNPVLSIVLSVLIGSLGIDRFYMGDIVLGILKLLTCAGCGIWYIIDLFLVYDRTKEINFNYLMENIAIIKSQGMY